MTIDPPGIGAKVGIPVIVPIPGMAMPVRSIITAVVIGSPPENGVETPNPAQTARAIRSPEPMNPFNPRPRDDHAAVRVPRGPADPARSGRVRLLPRGAAGRGRGRRPATVSARVPA